MTTRLTFGLIVAGAMFLNGVCASDAAAQNRRPVPNVRNQPAMPIVQNFPQVQHPSIQATLNNWYWSEWNRRAINTPIYQPIYIVQPYTYNFPWYMYGNYYAAPRVAFLR